MTVGLRRWAVGVAVTAACLFAFSAVRAEPDEQHLGKDKGYPLGDARSWYFNPNRVGAWSALDRVPGLQTRSVPRGEAFTPLLKAANPPEIRYHYQNRTLTLADYLERQRATGLLILKNGEIVAEHYRYGRKDDARFISFSMAKSVTSMLVGIALERGHIASLDDKAEKYVKGLAGSPYGGTAIRHLLRMSSGLTYTERYDGKDDNARLSRASAGVPGAGSPLEVLRSITERHAPPGEKFSYASAETDVLGRVLAAATGRTLADLTSDWLWQPMGAEHEALWRVSVDGQEQAQGGFNASLRDWGRLGMLLANDGRVGDRQVVPREYLLEATDTRRQPAGFGPRAATSYFGYGYQFWLLPMRTRTFVLQGIHGQTTYVQPATGIVLVLTSVWEKASGRQDLQPYEERGALWQGVLSSLGGNTSPD